jgi:putative sigma-54 modulation protein
MNVKISGHHLDVTTAIHDYINGKLERVLRHFDKITSVQVVISQEKLQKHIEVNIHVPNKDLHAEASDEDLYTAIDAVADKLDRQILKYKDKVKDHHHDAPKHLHSDSNDAAAEPEL